ncbi:phage integrase N-terminal SAM-like domain-containing protein [Spartinivicinus poritis]
MYAEMIMASLLLEKVRQIRVRHYSLKTEKCYLYWIRQYLCFLKINNLH